MVRLVPNVSLSEQSLEALVTLIEERAGVGESLLHPSHPTQPPPTPAVPAPVRCVLHVYGPSLFRGAVAMLIPRRPYNPADHPTPPHPARPNNPHLGRRRPTPHL